MNKIERSPRRVFKSEVESGKDLNEPLKSEVQAPRRNVVMVGEEIADMILETMTNVDISPPVTSVFPAFL